MKTKKKENLLKVRLTKPYKKGDKAIATTRGRFRASKNGEFTLVFNNGEKDIKIKAEAA